MKSDGNYRMHKSIKRILASIGDKKERNTFKKLAIQADVAYKSQDWVILGRGEKE